MPTAPTSLAAALSDRYRLDRELGLGGMATVYLARDLKHDRDVALKVLRPELAAVLGRERFLAEIHLTARLDHPHILTLIDSGESGGFLWYVVPFIRGESLRQKLERDKQLGLDEALAITKQVAGALDYAHRQGIIHRDIKPENILLQEGVAVLADFGIALAVREAGGNRLTESGLSLGTPQYMSPEQATGDRQLDARSDVYSLAAVLYEMLAGEPPHTGATVQAVIAKLLTEPPTRLRTIRETVPQGVDIAVAKALARVPADRYPSAAAFVAALDQPVATGRRINSRQVAALIGALLLLGVGAAAILLLRGEAPASPVTQRQLTYTGRAAWPAISPDGRRVAYVTSSRSLVVQPLAGGDPLVLVPQARFVGPPGWTGDGSAILFWMMRDTLVNGQLRLMTTWMIPSAGGPPREILPDNSPFDPGPDSTTVVWAQRNPPRIEIVSLSPFGIKQSIPVPDSLGEIFQVAWSPDRRWVAFKTNAVFLVPSEGGAIRRIANRGWSVRWAPSNDALYFLDDSGGSTYLMKVAVSSRGGEARGGPERVASLPGATEFDRASSGLVVYTGAVPSAQALAMTLSGERNGRVVESHLLTEGTAQVTGVAITGDGERVAYSRATADRERIEVVPFGGGSAQLLPPASATYPSWSPDGTRIAFMAWDSAGPRVMMMPYPGGTPQPIGSIRPGGLVYGERMVPPFWSADGVWLGYQASSLKRLAILDTRDQSESFVAIPESLGTAYNGAALSPDGRQVVASTIRKWNDWGQLWASPVSSPSWRHVKEPFGESTPIRWARDGRLLVLNHRVWMGESGYVRLEVWEVGMRDEVPQLLAVLPDGCALPSISSDGRRAACVLHADRSDLMAATGLIPAAR
jgi:serine/threonine protein kinase